MEIFSYITFFSLMIFIFYREHQAKKEREELVDRLMSKDLTDFKVNLVEDDNDFDEEDDEEILDIEEARDAIVDEKVN